MNHKDQRQGLVFIRINCDVVPPVGLEPTALNLEGSCSIQLSYEGFL